MSEIFCKGRKAIWEGNSNLDDKSFEGHTRELNAGFKKYAINTCIQKIAILAMTTVETGFFKYPEELSSNYASSKLLYKGRGMIQLTGSQEKGKDSPGVYAKYKKEGFIQEDIVKNPSLVGEKLNLAIDSGCWYFNEKKCPRWPHPTEKGKSETDGKLKERQEAFKWKREYFGEAAKEEMSLNAIAELMANDEDKYFFLISKLCHGYGLYQTNEKPASLNYEKRVENLQKIKNWFTYDKDVCDSLHIKNGEYCPICEQHHNDIAVISNWEPQSPGQCWKACVAILKNYGYEGGAKTNLITTVTQKGKELIPKNTVEGIDYIHDQLKQGKPVVVGVDDSLREETYNEGTTEHFILIVGYGCEGGKGFLRFFDPGTSHRGKGTSKENRLYIGEDSVAQGKLSGTEKIYTISQVRRNK